MFYGSILFKFIGVIVIWFTKSLFNWRVASFKDIWNGKKTNENNDLTDYLSCEIIQIFIGAIVLIIFLFFTTGTYKQIFNPESIGN
jgi:hypothetical protein